MVRIAVDCIKELFGNCLEENSVLRAPGGFTFDLKQEDGSRLCSLLSVAGKSKSNSCTFAAPNGHRSCFSLKSLCETGTGAPYPDDVDIG
jgi:hypothetical protein